MQDQKERGLLRLRVTSIDPTLTGSYDLVIVREFWQKIKSRLDRGAGVLCAIDDYLCVMRAVDGESYYFLMERLEKEKGLVSDDILTKKVK